MCCYHIIAVYTACVQIISLLHAICAIIVFYAVIMHADNMVKWKYISGLSCCHAISTHMKSTKTNTTSQTTGLLSTQACGRSSTTQMSHFNPRSVDTTMIVYSININIIKMLLKSRNAHYLLD